MRINVHKLWSLLLIVPLLSGCAQSDDVEAIFCKTWKLTYITVDGEHQMFDFWQDETAMKKSMELLVQPNNYTLTFEGVAEGDAIKGTFKGVTINAAGYNGTWSANGRTNVFKANVANGSRPDKLALNFLEGLNAASSYEGDTNNLYLIYTPASSQRTFRMCFRPKN